ncbi:uncharacterized protein LOC117500064 [Trematomus bernacchii]|uniref:uncharacterized protein LOC117500064 n=1 Tax=Trematomus bernacchii TaxID=40690 RepID=UPI00146B028B|nr:uncharacterized protein LOC117500064 [Trematomus bernacchii]
MSVLFWIWILMMENHALEVIKAHSGGAVLLTSDLQLQLKQDVRWTHPDLLVSLKNNVTACPHGRCQLLRDGSLRFSRVQPGDSGNYSLQVYEEDGTRVLRRDFLLLVESSQSGRGSSGSDSQVRWRTTCMWRCTVTVATRGRRTNVTMFPVILLFPWKHQYQRRVQRRTCTCDGQSELSSPACFSVYILINKVRLFADVRDVPLLF